MLTKTQSSTALQGFFKKKCTATLSDLFSLLQTTSRMSVFRRLQAVNYLSSYTHAGRYYTLPAIAQFDDQGLWHYEGVSFSKAGHLKQTLERQVEQSEAGKTHDELETQLKVRVHNSLLGLVRLNKISRQNFQGIFLYLSIDPARAKTQREHRNRLHLPVKHNAVSDWTVVEVLAQIIRSHRLTVNDQEIATALCDRGIDVTALQVAQILKQMDVKKTLD